LSTEKIKHREKDNLLEKSKQLIQVLHQHPGGMGDIEGCGAIV